MKKKIIALFAALVMLLPASLAITSNEAAHATTLGPAIFLVPHQDDETLTFGPAIKEHLLAGRNVIVVLLTDGSESSVCYWKYGNNGQTFQTKPDVAAMRAAGGLTPTERADCTAERDSEFTNALNAVSKNVPGTLTIDIRSDRKQDSCSDPSIAATSDTCTAANTLTADYVESVITDYENQYKALGEEPSFKAQTYKESLHCDGCDNGTTGPGHPDHDAVGEGLRQAYNDGITSDARWYVKVTLWHLTAGNTGDSDYFPTLFDWTSHTHENISGMLKAYKNFGWFSVACSFKDQEAVDGGMVTTTDWRPWTSTYGQQISIDGKTTGDGGHALCTKARSANAYGDGSGADTFYHVPGA